MTGRRYLITTAIAASAFAALYVAIAAIDPRPRFIWNASASAPIGLYRIHPTDAPSKGELLAVAPPERLSRWLSQRGYLPRGVPLLKHVAAGAGQRICRTGPEVTIDGVRAVFARAHDRSGRALPVWRGCRTLRTGELFLLNPSHPDSLDGRYFGPLPLSTVIGRATPLYVRAPSATSSTPEAKEFGHADEHL